MMKNKKQPGTKKSNNSKSKRAQEPTEHSKLTFQNNGFEKVTRALRMLSGCNRVVVRSTNESHLLNEICRIIVEVGGYRLAWIGYREENKKKEVRPVAQMGYDEGYLNEMNFTWENTALGRGPTGTCIRTGKPSVIKNIVIDPIYKPWKSEATKRGYASAIGLPLLNNNEAFGALTIYAGEPDAFDSEEVQLLLELANDLAYGIIALRTREEHRQAEEALRNSEARIAGILDLAGDAVISIDSDQKIQIFNKGAERIFGYKSSEMMGKPLDVLLPPRFVKSHEKLVNDFGKSKDIARLMGQRNEIVGLRKDGSEFPAEASISKFKQDDEYIFTVMLRDLTQRKDTEKRILESEERYRSFFMEDISGDFIADLDGNILDCNPAFAHIFGFQTTEEAKQFKLVQIFPDENAWKKLLDVLVEKKKLVNVEREFKDFHGRTLEILANIFANEDAEGNIISVKGYFLDITERKKMETQLIQSQRMEAIGRLAGGIAHDFNNTLTAIQGFCDLLSDLGGDESQALLIEEIEKAAKSAISLNRQLLTFSRKQVVQPKLMNINTITRRMRKMLRPMIGEQVEFNFVLADNLGYVRMDPGQVEQIIMNLAVNARDAMPEGGKLTIETRNIDLDENYVDQHISVSSGSYVMLAVSDNGIGMDEKTQLQIFEPFFTTKKKGKGTGLGLSTVYGIVTQNSGYIWVYSEPDHGTTFKIYLPRVTDEVEAGEIIEPKKEQASGTETVLVVEDDERVRRMIFLVLRSNGYNILEAERGHDALQLVDEYEGKIHLMLTDVIMPEMSGIELAKKINDKYPKIKILYMSGYTDNSIMNHHELEPGINFLEKPFSAHTLSTKVREILDKKSASA